MTWTAFWPNTMRELSLNILDIAQNSVSAGASLITLAIDEQGDRMTVSIEDNGCGMSEEQLARVRDPFFTTRTTRKVGMGIPLFRMVAEMTGGSLEISSEQGKGTKVTAVFCTDHIDCLPLGDITGTVTALVSLNEHIDFVYRHTVGGKLFEMDTRQLREVLGDVPFSEPDVLLWMTEYIQENLQDIGVFN